MKHDVRGQLLALMNEIGQKMDGTRMIARLGCSEDEAEIYSARVDEILQHVEAAKATILAMRGE